MPISIAWFCRRMPRRSRTTMESLVVYGAGPVGLLAAYSAIIKGASQVMVVDRHKDRLRLAEKIGAIPIDDSLTDPVDSLMKLTHGEGVDKGCECVGWQCHDPAGHEVPNDTMNKLVDSVRSTGAIGVVGVFVPKDPKAEDALMKEGQIAFNLGLFFEKSLRLGSGQTPVKAYNRMLCQLIAAGKAKPSFLVSHELPLAEAPDAYRHFDAREDGWTKVVLKPAAFRRRPAGFASRASLPFYRAVYSGPDRIRRPRGAPCLRHRPTQVPTACANEIAAISNFFRMRPRSDLARWATFDAAKRSARSGSPACNGSFPVFQLYYRGAASRGACLGGRSRLWFPAVAPVG
jgi:Zinc-binding dehydrogenase